MSLIVRLGTVAGGSSTTAWDSGYRTGAEVSQGEKLLQQLASSGFQFGQRMGQMTPPSLSIYIYSEIKAILAYIVKPPFPSRTPSHEGIINETGASCYNRVFMENLKKLIREVP